MAILQQGQNEVTLLNFETGVESGDVVTLDKDSYYVFEGEMKGGDNNSSAVVYIYADELDPPRDRIFTIEFSGLDRIKKTPMVPPIRTNVLATVGSISDGCLVNLIVRAVR